MTYISLIITLKPDYFQLCFLYKGDLPIYVAEKRAGINT